MRYVASGNGKCERADKMKKKIAAAVLASAFAAATMLYAGAAERQYIQNGGFESGLGGWQSTWQSGGGTIEAAQTDDGKALHIKTESGRGYIQQNLTNITEGDRLTLSFKIKTVSLAEGSNAAITLGYRDKAGQYITQENVGYSEVTEDRWAYKDIDIVVPEGVGQMYILVRLNGGGEVYYDDIDITDFYNKTEIKLEANGLELSGIADGIDELCAKLHFVPSAAKESGALVLAAYDSQKRLTSVKTKHFTASNPIYTSVTLPLDEKTDEVQAFVWNGGIGERATLTRGGSVIDSFAAEKMRGAYGALGVFYDKEKMNKLEESGINTFIFNLIGGFHGAADVNKDQNALDAVCTDLEEYAAESGNRVFVKASYGARCVVNNDAYGAYHPGKKHELTLPCPLSEKYWDEEMMSRLEMAARHEGICGVVFDMEMYSGGNSYYPNACLCDSCVKKYAAEEPGDETAELVKLSAEERLGYMLSSCMLEDYSEWFAEKVTELTSKLEKRLHKINPNLIIGNMPGFEWLPGITAGFGTEEMPLMVFAEETYKGTTAITSVHKSYAEKKNLNAVFAVGLWSNNDSAINTASFAGKLGEAVEYDTGYWIYAVQELDKDEKFYEALKKGNDKISGK